MAKKSKYTNRRKQKDDLSPEKRAIKREELGQRLTKESQKQASTGSMIFEDIPLDSGEEPLICVAFDRSTIEKHLSVIYDAYVPDKEIQEAIPFPNNLIKPTNSPEVIAKLQTILKPLFIEIAIARFDEKRKEFLQLATDYLYHTLYAHTMAEIISIPDNLTQKEIEENWDSTADLKAEDFQDLPLHTIAQRLIDDFSVSIKNILGVNKGKPKRFAHKTLFHYKLTKAFKQLVKTGKPIDKITQEDVAPILGTDHARQVREWLKEYELDWEKCKQDFKIQEQEDIHT